MAYRRKRLSRFEKSQRAHERLVNFHEKRWNSDLSRRLHSYHVEVYNTQNRRGTILSRKERKKIYSGWVKP